MRINGRTLKHRNYQEALGIPLITASFYFIVFFPFIEIWPIDSDTQPYALLLSMVISSFFFFSTKRIPRIFIFFAAIFFSGIFIALFSTYNLNTVRRIWNYASLLFIPLATFYILQMNNGLNRSFIKFTIIVWTLVGLVQTVFAPNFLAFAISNSRTKYDRGVFSLATEPTYYAIVCLFLFFIVMLFFQKQDKKIYGFVLILQIVLFAKSSLIVFFLIMLGFLYAIMNINRLYADLNFRKVVSGSKARYLFVLGSFMLIAVLSFHFFDCSSIHDLRLIKMFRLFFDNPLFLILKDKSGNERFGHIFFCFLGFLKNFGLPNGFNEWEHFLTNNIPEFKSVFWYMKPMDIIMSGYGAALFELGIIGLLIPLIVSLCIYHYFHHKNKRNFWLYLIGINALMVNAIPLAFPIFNFFIGCLIYYSMTQKDILDFGLS